MKTLEELGVQKLGPFSFSGVIDGSGVTEEDLANMTPWEKRVCEIIAAAIVRSHGAQRPERSEGP
jgi:hypothetical protein